MFFMYCAKLNKNTTGICSFIHFRNSEGNNFVFKNILPNPDLGYNALTSVGYECFSKALLTNSETI